MRKNKKEIKRQITQLFNLADKSWPDKEKANMYIRKARNASMSIRQPLTKEQKFKFCKRCYAYLKPGVNARIRTRDGKLITKCKECNYISRRKIR